MHVRLFHYIYGNYNDTRVRIVDNLASEFSEENQVIDFPNININFDDGVMLQLTLKVPDNLVESINYLTLDDGNGNIKPYYVLGYVYDSKDNYHFSCKLDTVLYKLAFIRDSVANIERGFVDDTNKLIYNEDGIRTTSIKESEIPLREGIRFIGSSFIDTPDFGWYAVFANPKLGVEEPMKLRSDMVDPAYDAYYTSVNDFPLYTMVNKTVYRHTLQDVRMVVPTISLIENSDSPFVSPSNAGYRIRNIGIERQNIISSSFYDDAGVTYRNNYLGSQGSTWYTTIGPQSYAFNSSTLKYDFNARILRSAGNLVTSRAKFASAQGLNGTPNYYNFPLNESALISTFYNKAAGFPVDGHYDGGTIVNLEPHSEIMSWNNKIIKTQDGRFYRVVVNVRSNGSYVKGNSDSNMINYLNNKFINNSNADSVVNPDADTVATMMNNVIEDQIGEIEADRDIEVIFEGDKIPALYSTSTYQYEVLLNELVINNAESVPFSNAADHVALPKKANNVPYKIILFPYGDVEAYYKETPNAPKLIQSEEYIINVVSNLYTDHSADIYDVQKIPYSSIDFNLNEYAYFLDGNISFISPPVTTSADINFNLLNELYLAVKNDTPLVAFFVANETTRRFQISYMQPFEKGASLKTDLRTKRAVIASNSIKSLFEYEYAKNNYSNKYNVVIDLKPFATFYNIEPIIDPNGIMKMNFSDGYGLTASEDRSVTLISDAYTEYARNNFNYQNSFNSQQNYALEKLDLEQRQDKAMQAQKQKQERTSMWVQTGIDAAAVGVQAAMGNPFAATGAVGTGKGAIGDLTSTFINQHHSRKNLAMQQGFDKATLALGQAQERAQFDFQIDNIQRLPYRLDKVSGISTIERTVPFIAVYGTTQEEESRLLNYYRYNGYSLNYIDILDQYIDKGYVKGTIIRSDSAINNTLLQDINQRLMAGIYFLAKEE